MSLCPLPTDDMGAICQFCDEANSSRDDTVLPGTSTGTHNPWFYLSPTCFGRRDRLICIGRRGDAVMPDDDAEAGAAFNLVPCDHCRSRWI